MSVRSVYVVDDEEAVRRSLKVMLSVGGYSVSVFETGAALLNVAHALVPGAVLLDVRMPEMDGVEVQRQLTSAGVGLPVVVMTGHGDISLAVTALQQGAVAFLEKPFSKAALSHALDAAFAKLEAPDAYASQLAAAARAVEALDDAQRSLLVGLAAGWSSEKIAVELGTSMATAELQRSRLYAELGVNCLNDALRVAFAAGLSPRG